VYAKDNPRVEYQQGMHELLAPIYYIVDCEKVIVSEENPATFLFDDRYVVHDSYVMFSAMMGFMGDWYSQLEEEENSDDLIIQKCHNIQNVLIKKFDPYLSGYLLSLEIIPQVYLLRWIRVIFSREIELNDTYLLWDLILAYDNKASLIDYIAVAMIILKRETLISSDSNGIFSLLFDYPKDIKLTEIIEKAMDLIEGKVIPKNLSPEKSLTNEDEKQFNLPKKPISKEPEINNRDEELEKRLDLILNSFQHSLIENTELSNDVPNDIFFTLAELKQIKLVLGHSIPLNTLTPLDIFMEQLSSLQNGMNN